MISRAELQSLLDKARTTTALVIGDVMLDKYIIGDVNRISPEAPVPVLQHKKTEFRAGGAANVAMNLAAWGCQTHLIGLTGADQSAKELVKMLEQQGIHHHLVETPGRPTTIKTRVLAASHHLLRIDEESSAYLTGDLEKMAMEQIAAVIRDLRPGLIIIEDYNKGLLSVPIIEAIIRLGKETSAFIAVDPKEKNFFAYRGVHLFKPNWRETLTAAGRPLELQDLAMLCRTWREEHDFQTLAVTLGSEGMFLQNGVTENLEKPEREIDVVDVCGAGDAVICALAIPLMHGWDIHRAGWLANLAGAFVCSHSGVVALDLNVLGEWMG